MSVRGIWVISENELNNPKILFSRRWLTVERRAKSCSGVYEPIPSDMDLAQEILLKCAGPTKEFSVFRDSCLAIRSDPVYELRNGRLWPVICIQKNSLLFVCVPLVESLGSDRPAHSEIPAISCAIILLDSVIEIVGTDIKVLDETSSKFSELYQFLVMAAPFGAPLQTSVSAVAAQLQQMRLGNKPTPMPKYKQPSWQQVTSLKGGGKLSLVIKEELQAVQYDKATTSDSWQLSGTIQCRTELEGNPEILLVVTTPTDTRPLDHLLTHPCVQTADVQMSTDLGSEHSNRKVRFSAPFGETFSLAHYKWSSLSFLPIRGFYQMKGDKPAKLLVQLKLNDAVRNYFEYCEIHIPFFNRGGIEKVDNIVPVTVSSALALSHDRKVIIWTIGQKFPGKSLEVSLQATVHFYEHTSLGPPSAMEDDPFCTGLNAYIDVFFKIPDYTLSGCNIDGKSITLFPNSKYKLLISRELHASCYRIWNSHGDAILTWPQLKLKT